MYSEWFFKHFLCRHLFFFDQGHQTWACQGMCHSSVLYSQHTCSLIPFQLCTIIKHIICSVYMRVQCTAVNTLKCLHIYMFDLGGSAWEILLFTFFSCSTLVISSGMERSGMFGFNFTNLGKGLVKPYCIITVNV